MAWSFYIKINKDKNFLLSNLETFPSLKYKIEVALKFFHSFIFNDISSWIFLIKDTDFFNYITRK